MSNALAENLKSLMWTMRLNESELARRTSIGQPVLNRLIKGITKNPNVDTLRPIAKFFSVTIEQLIGDAPLSALPSHLEKLPTKNIVAIPIINWDEVGQWEQLKMTYATNKVMQVELEDDVSKGHLFALRVEDSTMEPTFTHNTIIVVDTLLTPIDRDYVVVQLHDQTRAVFKQILFNGDLYYLKSLNPNFELIRTTFNNKVIGVVIKAYMNLKSR